jgi:thiamine-monophosphate kinase
MAAGEFDLIAQYFAPLAPGHGARGLLDDAALLDVGPIVITTDAIVEGVHFLPGDPIGSIAQKALRVNLSDLAAKGARPLGYLLSLQWPDTRPAQQIAAFAQGLAQDQAQFGISLLGGDTTRTPGPLSISVTAYGHPLRRDPPARAHAQTGDDVWVTGTIGDAVLGLAALQGETLGLSDDQLTVVIERYRRPQPRVAAAGLIARVARASMDVSDGLLGDALKIARASGVAIDLSIDAIPYSDAGERWIGGDAFSERAQRLSGGGDDYEILFTASADKAASITAWQKEHDLPVTRIGAVRAGAGAGAGVTAGSWPIIGFSHRLGTP